jgi:hypothetical protein
MDEDCKPARRSASSMKCVVITMTRSFLNDFSRDHRWRREEGSKPADGSSKKTTYVSYRKAFGEMIQTFSRMTSMISTAEADLNLPFTKTKASNINTKSYSYSSFCKLLESIRFL